MFTLSLINPTTETPFFTRATRNAVWSTTRTGDERLRAIIDDIALSDAVVLFDKATFAFVRISKNAEIAWQGVVTDVQLTYDNNRYALVVNAVGYAILYKNKLVTGVFSTTDTSKFFLLTEEQIGNSVSDSRVTLDTSQDILIKIRGNSTFYGDERISVGYRCPDAPEYAIKYVRFSIFSLYPTSFEYRFWGATVPYHIDWEAPYQILYTPTPGIMTFTLPNPYQGIAFLFRAPTQFTIPNDMYIRIYNVRLSTASLPITASKIMNLRGVHVINNVSSESDLLNVIVEDKTDAELFDLVCQQDNLEYTTLAPNVVELRKRDNLENRTKYRIVADTVTIARDATTIVNRAYARFLEPSTNYTLRTERVEDTIGREVFANGIYRHTVIDVDTYNYFYAVAKRDELLAKMRSGSMRLRATTRNVTTAAQSPVPVWKVRAGAIAGVVNLGRIGYGQVSEVIIDRTDYDAATDTLTIESQIDAL